ncbi:hypothetical protein IMSAGC007_00529 [Lachnospiraceae bacterium]|nr:hypothetical protein IMSAGC007_00529 [Lachnospiraceae bacterium]
MYTAWATLTDFQSHPFPGIEILGKVGYNQSIKYGICMIEGEER